MSKIHIMTDSCSDISPEIANRLGIEVVGIEITIGGKTITEFYDVTPEQYWKMLAAEPEVPTTAQITPVRFVERFEAAFEAGYDSVLMVTINSKGSGTYNSCMVAKGLFEEEHPGAMRIEVLDGEMYSRIYGNAVIAAAEMRDDGVPFDEIVKQTRTKIRRGEAVLWCYSLKQLKKSGRVNGAAAFVGEALGLKPVMRLVAGQIDILAKARGERNAIPEAIKQIEKYIRDPEHQILRLMYTDVAPAEIDKLEQALRDAFHPAGIERLPLGPCVATNIGPNSLAVIYDGEQRG